MKNEKILRYFNELTEEWGKIVLMDHLMEKTILRKEELKAVLDKLTVKKTKQGSFVSK